MVHLLQVSKMPGYSSRGSLAIAEIWTYHSMHSGREIGSRQPIHDVVLMPVASLWNTSGRVFLEHSATPIPIAKEEAIEEVELRPVVPIMLEVGSHTQTQIDTRHVGVEIVTRCSVQKIHVRYSDKV